MIALGAEIDVAHLGDLQRGGQGFRHFAEQRRHFVVALQIVRVVRHPHAVLLADQRAGADAQHDVLRGRVFLLDVVRVVGGDGPHVEFFRQLQQVPIDVDQFREAFVPLQFDEEALAPEDVHDTSPCALRASSSCPSMR